MLAERLEGPERARDVAGRRLTDVPDAEREQEAFERDAAARIDGAEQVLDRFLAETLPLGERLGARGIALLQREDIGRRADQPLVVEQLDALAAEPFDVERETRDEMLEPLLRLRRTDEPAGAAEHGAGFRALLALVTRGVAAASRAVGWEDIGLRAALAACRERR